ncbi:zinc finger protein 879-like isoform X2 [Branchiostoma floridae]|uniref:Zinc finger protein 879-like isoform X2 n=1 Tax=Branchiostoma floridae TaxID=7739 RepID=A0A9J7M9R7_BRAFL|nr:zinc finger protein 879-like isoform X2 [Branchiostoma floridae]
MEAQQAVEKDNVTIDEGDGEKGVQIVLSTEGQKMHQFTIRTLSSLADGASVNQEQTGFDCLDPQFSQSSLPAASSSVTELGAASIATTLSAQEEEKVVLCREAVLANDGVVDDIVAQPTKSEDTMFATVGMREQSPPVQVVDMSTGLVVVNLPNPLVVLNSGLQKSPDNLTDSQHANMAALLRIQAMAQAGQMSNTQYMAAVPKPAAKPVHACSHEFCGKKFTSSSHLKYHEMSHTGERLLKCQVVGCDRTFTWPAHLKYHMKTHTGERQYRCPAEGCDSTFYTPQRLRVHVRTHTGERPFRCTEEGCGKAFTTAQNLRNHMRTHTGERPFACQHEGCNKRFTEYSSLKKHQNTHTGERQYACDVCGKQFTQSGSRNTHRRKHQLFAIQAGEMESGELLGQRTVSGDMGLSMGLRQTEDILGIQGLDGSESAEDNAVFSHPSSDNIVTVTTQLPDKSQEADQICLSHNLMAADAQGLSQPSTANVVVVAQPAAIASMATGASSYHDNHPGSSETLAYGTGLLQSELSAMTQNMEVTEDSHSDKSTPTVEQMLDKGDRQGRLGPTQLVNKTDAEGPDS